MASVVSYSLYGKTGVLQRKAAFSISVTISVAVKDVGGGFFHPIGRVRFVDTKSSSSLSDEKTSSRLGVT